MRIARRSFVFGLMTRMWAQDPTFSSSVRVVSILATVGDKEGRIVKSLTKDDFALLVDGIPQQIRYFSADTDLPLTIGLLVDTSRSQIGVLEPERRASQTFLDRVLRPDRDRAFVAHFDERLEVVQNPTASRTDLAAALQMLSIPGHFATLIFSAVRECAERLMRKQTGRKAFILLTDGVAFRDETSIETAIEFAQQADAILYSIRFSDPIKTLHPVKPAVLAEAKQRGKNALQRMVNETGGAVFDATHGCRRYRGLRSHRRRVGRPVVSAR